MKGHYGLEEVKQRILEFIAAQQLSRRQQSNSSAPGGAKIICLLGPPGVGKTSIAHSISLALSRPSVHLSLGGLTDVSELKGNRRTYVGAMPGKIAMAMKKTGVSNPVIIMDEIDKIGGGRSGGGNVMSALLEIFDSSQQSTFMDHYLNLPLDLSHTLFLCTANSIGSIPTPLLDRMEFITIPGYTFDEKEIITKKYIINEVAKKCGVKEGEEVKMEDETIKEMIQG